MTGYLSGVSIMLSGPEWTATVVLWCDRCDDEVGALGTDRDGATLAALVEVAAHHDRTYHDQGAAATRDHATQRDG